MQIKRYQSAKDFLKDNLSFLEQEEAANNLQIGIPFSFLEKEITNSTLVLIAVFKNDKPVFLCVQTPPRNLLLYGKQEMTKEIFEVFLPYLIKEEIQVTGVIASKALAEAFAEAWKTSTGNSWKINFEQLVYRLDHLKEVRPTNGHLRNATPDDFNVLGQWFYDFAIEAMGQGELEKEKTNAKSKIESGQLFVWEDESKVVSMASIARPSRNGITVNYVFTPPDLRGRGYASNCVAEMSKLMLDNYQFCCLFTDLKNPSSNKIYRDMGYVVVAEYLEILFK